MTRLVPSTLDLRDVLCDIEATFEALHVVGICSRVAVEWRGHTFATSEIPWTRPVVDWLESLGAIRLLTTEEMRELGAVLSAIGKVER